jgi:hypothetical protein
MALKHLVPSAQNSKCRHHADIVVERTPVLEYDLLHALVELPQQIKDEFADALRRISKPTISAEQHTDVLLADRAERRVLVGDLVNHVG